MSRIIGEENTQRCIIRKYTSMQKWLKDYCIRLHPFRITLEKNTANRGSPQLLMLVQQFRSPFSRPPGNNCWDFWGTLVTLQDLQGASQDAVTTGEFQQQTRLLKTVCSAMLVVSCRAWSLTGLGAATAPTDPDRYPACQRPWLSWAPEEGCSSPGLGLQEVHGIYLQWIQQMVTKMIKKSEHLIFKGRLGHLELFTLEHNSTQGRFYQCEGGQILERVSQRCCWVSRDGLAVCFSWSCSKQGLGPGDLQWYLPASATLIVREF